MKIKPFPLATIALLVLLASGVWLFLQSRGLELTSFTDQETGITFSYPIAAQQQHISEDDKANNIVLRLSEGKDQEPYLVTLRYEKGLGILATTLKRELLDVLLDNSNKVLPSRFPGYAKQSEERFEIYGRKAALITFTYENQGTTLKQAMLIIVLDNDRAAYLSQQAKNETWIVLEKDVFLPIRNSIRLSE